MAPRRKWWLEPERPVKPASDVMPENPTWANACKCTKPSIVMEDGERHCLACGRWSL